MSRATLSFFFTLHFVLPFVMAVVVFAHLLMLHEVSRRSSVMIHASCSKIKFNPFFSLKDVLNVCLLWLLYGLSFISPWRFGDPENWAPANPLLSPVHIQPEWYFLFAYEILRSIPSKLGGVVALALRVLSLYFLSLAPSRSPHGLFLLKVVLCGLFHSFVVLSWLGGCSVVEPFVGLGKVYTAVYFSSLLLVAVLCYFSASRSDS